MKKYKGIVYLAISALFTYGLFCINLNDLPRLNIPWISKYFSYLYILKFEQFKHHEAFTYNHSDQNVPNIILSGSCQLMSLWCKGGERESKCSIANLLQMKMQREINKKFKVYNLAWPTHSTVAYNLFVLMSYLKLKSHKVFLFHNELTHEGLISLIAANDSNILRSLLKEIDNLVKGHPQIEELNILQEKLKKVFLNKKDPAQKNFYSLFYTNFKELGASIFEMNGKKIIDLMNNNTIILRHLEERFKRYMAFFSPISNFKKYELLLKSRPSENKFKNMPPGGPDPKQNFKYVYKDYFMILSLMDKLASIYQKEIYIYFGPEGNCKKNNNYTTLYKKPISDFTKSLTNVSFIDLTSITIDVNQDTIGKSCNHYNYLGNNKIAQGIFDFFLLKKNEEKNEYY